MGKNLFYKLLKAFHAPFLIYLIQRYILSSYVRTNEDLMSEFMQLRWEESVPQISFPSAMD